MTYQNQQQQDGPSRVDGRAKVTGTAKYIAEFSFPRMVHGYLVQSTIAKGKIRDIDVADAEKQPGVVKVLSHKNLSKLAIPAPAPDAVVRPFYALTSDEIRFNAQPIAVVVAETFEQARYAASLVKVTYDKADHSTDLAKVIDAAFTPGREQPNRGTPEEVFAAAEIKIDATYTIPIEHHNAMEPHATVANWENGKLTVYDKTQGIQGTTGYLAGAFGIDRANVRVLSPFVGGAFGAALRPGPNLIIAAMASREIGRPVKVVYSRRQLATAHGYRPESIQTVKVAADKEGKLTSLTHEATHNTSGYENFSESLVGMARGLYACPNVRTVSKIAV